MSRPLWQLLLLAGGAEEPIQLTCAECFALLEYDAELLAEGAPFDKIRSAASRHLSLCPECKTQFDEWIEKCIEKAKSPT
jgi:hypothetical protein